MLKVISIGLRDSKSDYLVRCMICERVSSVRISSKEIWSEVYQSVYRMCTMCACALTPSPDLRVGVLD